MIWNALVTHMPSHSATLRGRSLALRAVQVSQWRAVPGIAFPAEQAKSALCEREGYNPSNFARDHVKNRDHVLRGLTLHRSGREPGRRIAQAL